MKKYILSFSILFLFLSSGIFVFAASRIYFEKLQGALAPGSTFPLRILIDSDDPLNAYDVEFGYNMKVVDITGFDNGRSLIQVWQDNPGTNGGRVRFSGASISPFSGNKGELLTINMKALSGGIYPISFGNVLFYKADGKGTLLTPKKENVTINVLANATSGTVLYNESAIQDTTPPEIRELTLTPDPFNKNQSILGFLTTDKDSGVKETFLRTISWVLWSDSQSVVTPVIIPGNVWAIEVKTVDNQGNATEKVLYVWPIIIQRILMALGAFLIIAVVINRILAFKNSYNNRRIL